MQVFNSINARKLNQNEINVFEGIKDNIYYIFVQSFIILGQILLVTFGGRAVRTQPLSISQHIACALIASLSLVVGFFVKLIPFYKDEKICENKDELKRKEKKVVKKKSKKNELNIKNKNKNNNKKESDSSSPIKIEKKNKTPTSNSRKQSFNNMNPPKSNNNNSISKENVENNISNVKSIGSQDFKEKNIFEDLLLEDNKIAENSNNNKGKMDKGNI